MNDPRRAAVVLGAMVFFAVAAPGCDGQEETGQAGSTGSPSGGGGHGGQATAGAGGQDGDPDPSPADAGSSASELVCSGGYGKSEGHSLAVAIGQSTQNHGRSKSANYIIQGGLLGATGSMKR